MCIDSHLNIQMTQMCEIRFILASAGIFLPVRTQTLKLLVEIKSKMKAVKKLSKLIIPKMSFKVPQSAEKVRLDNQGSNSRS